jgi:NAD(P)-dependent dehydrogenase (short-subunit alcohol dehydrogenase family)
MFRDDLLRGKRILVTGGGTGLGKSIARRYLELGAAARFSMRPHRSCERQPAAVSRL